MANNLSTCKDILRILLGVISLLFITECWGGNIKPLGGTKDVVLDAELGHFPAYTKGSKLKVYFDSSYVIDVTYRFNDISRAYTIYNSLSNQDFLLPVINGGKLKVNDDLNISAMDINSRRILPVFVDKRMFFDLLKDFHPSSRTGKLSIPIRIKGSLTLELSRDIIGGATILPTKVPLFFTYPAKRDYYIDVDYSTVLTRFYLKTGGVIPMPVLCKINLPGGEHIDFGNIVTDSLTPARESENRQTITLDYRCNAAKTLPVDIHLLAGHASFSDAVIASTNPAVGVSLTRNGLPLSPGGKFSTRLQDGQGHDTLTATVTRNPAVAPGAVDTGPFSASAILILEQQ